MRLAKYKIQTVFELESDVRLHLQQPHFRCQGDQSDGVFVR